MDHKDFVFLKPFLERIIVLKVIRMSNNSTFGSCLRMSHGLSMKTALIKPLSSSVVLINLFGTNVNVVAKTN